MITPAIGIANLTDETSTTENWSTDLFIDYLSRSNEELIPKDELPQSIALSYDVMDEIESKHKFIQPTLASGNTRNVVGSTYYSTHQVKLEENAALDLTYYYCNFDTKLPQGMANHIYPPEPELLIPILDGHRFRAGEVRGYLCVSNKISFLFLRTKETMQIIGNESEPQYFAQAKLPNWFMPNLSGNPIRSAHNFKVMCHHANLGVFVRPAFPKSEKYPIFEKLDLLDQ